MRAVLIRRQQTLALMAVNFYKKGREQIVLIAIVARPLNNIEQENNVDIVPYMLQREWI